MNLFARIKYRIARVIRLWVKPTFHPSSADKFELDDAAETYYVLANNSATDIVAAQLGIEQLNLPKAHSSHWHFLTRNEGFFARKRIYSPETAATMIAKANNGANIQLIPISVFWGRTPKKEHSFWRLLFSYSNFDLGGGFRKFFATIAARKDLEVHFGRAFDINLLLGEHDTPHLTRKLQRILRIHFRQMRTAVIGPDLSHRRTLVNDLVRSKSVQQVIESKLASGEDSREKLEHQAEKYGLEIVSNLNMRSVRILDKILSWFWNRVYDGVEVEGIDRVRDLARTHTLVYLPCHRSHIDYLLLSYALFKQGLMVPHIAAGINLNMPIVGRLLRGAGAFFIRRSFKGKPLYTAVFNEYLHQLLKQGFPVEFYIEGGRSRTGRSLPPKTGMLALMLRSYLRDHSKPIALVPIYVGYEKVLEEYTYLGELRGKAKKSESVFDIFKVFSVLKENHGKVRANFATPMLLNDFLDAQNVDWRHSDTTKPEWLSTVTNQLGDEIITRINEAAHINSTALVATSMLGSPKQALSYETLKSQIELNQALARAFPYSEVCTVDEASADDIIEHTDYLGYLRSTEDTLGTVYQLGEIERVLMAYYRNNVQHVFVLPSMLAYALNNKRGIGRKALINLVAKVYPFLQRELFTNVTEGELETKINQTLDWLIEHRLLTQQGNTVRGADAGTAEQVQQRLLASYVRPIIERFYIVLKLISRVNPGDQSQGELEAMSAVIAQRLSMLHGINSPEFFDKRLFKGFIEQLLDQDVIHCSDGRIQYEERLLDTVVLAERVMSAEIAHNLNLATINKPTS
ncbi:MAG: glycerol-3-phosphate 1-O-acyltransferase PlsB [Gammaproteobacteria bacterium]|nr:glycerol-3-phosphate 1-O-acyltransferase PlsB [Gammaproteobacteria bacterium]